VERADGTSAAIVYQQATQRLYSLFDYFRVRRELFQDPDREEFLGGKYELEEECGGLL
jgi:hypothetical protein